MKSEQPEDRPASLARLQRLSAYEAGELDEAQAQQVRAELAASPDARRALEGLEKLRQVTATLAAPELSEARRHAIGAAAVARARAQQVRRRLATAGGFTALAAAAVVLLLLARRPGQPDHLAQAPAAGHLRTGAGDFRLLPIGDRAVAFVGEDTELEVHPGATPAVRLLRGSVRLMVRRRVTEPFIVNTPAADVAVLGTEFDVSVVQGETDVSVVRGEVEVRNPQGRRRLWARESARARPGQPPRLLVPPRGVVSEGAPQVETHPAATPARVPSAP